jgi:DNA-binding CsgD family transcriptional regulator
MDHPTDYPTRRYRSAKITLGERAELYRDYLLSGLCASEFALSRGLTYSQFQSRIHGMRTRGNDPFRPIREETERQLLSSGQITEARLARIWRPRLTRGASSWPARAESLLRLLAAGKRPRDIALALEVSLNTVYIYLQRLRRERGCDSVWSLISEAVRSQSSTPAPMTSGDGNNVPAPAEAPTPTP